MAASLKTLGFNITYCGTHPLTKVLYLLNINTNYLRKKKNVFWRNSYGFLPFQMCCLRETLTNSWSPLIWTILFQSEMSLVINKKLILTTESLKLVWKFCTIIIFNLKATKKHYIRKKYSKQSCITVVWFIYINF